ncbi:hypothetical protein BDZ45DRAFT_738893 [Acephala macrosclerotiorum]|nr:hypothetical protein BDZ45DRAFT_738893 [Acephala macrosclerotiorum]
MPNTTQKERCEFMIEHITYGATHQPMKSYIPASISNKTDSSTSSQRPRASIEQALSRNVKPSQTARPSTQWPNAEMRVATADLASFVLQKGREGKEKRKQEKLVIKANSSGRYLSLLDEKSSAATKVTPNLRRKEKFSKIVMAKLNKLSHEDEKQLLVQNDANMQRFEEIRKAIKEGKMERVVPPRTEAEKERLAPRRYSVSQPSSSRSAPAAETKPKVKSSKDRKSVDHWKNRLSGSKLSAYLEKGKEIQREDEEEQRSNTNAIKALKMRQGENRRRLSGEGSSPWSSPANQRCRLCNKWGTQGVRGLCSECEDDFLRPKTSVGLGTSFSDSEDEDEIKPTPPLKDRKTLSMRKSPDRNYLLHVPAYANEEWEDERPTTPVKGSIRLESVNARSEPSDSSVSPRIFSQQAEIEDQEDSDAETVKRWNSGPFKPISKENKNLFEKWSAVYQNGDYRQFQAEDGTPLIPIAQKRSPAMRKLSPNAHQKSLRDSSFYDFWGELLGDDSKGRITVQWRFYTSWNLYALLDRLLAFTIGG